MNCSRFIVDHIRLTSEQPFEAVAKVFESQLGRFDQSVVDSLAASADSEETKDKIAAMAGPSGFMLFGTTNHGSLLSLAGQKRKACQYIVGHPLIALQMTQQDIRASLYAPLRVLLYKNDEGKTCLEYDKPSSLFGQFRNSEINSVATMLDQKLAELVAAAIG